MDERQVLRAAYLYYRAGLTQAQIADRLHVGRITVGRMLAAALDRGIVTIDIHHPLARVAEMEAELQARHGLRHVIVAETVAMPDQPEELRMLAAASAAAAHLSSLKLRDCAIAVGWGTTMRAVAQALTDGWADGLEVFQLNGAVPLSMHSSEAVDIMHRFSETSGSRAHLLQAPAIVEHSAVRAALETDRSVRLALEGARTAPVAVFSLGALRNDSVLVSSGYLDDAELSALSAEGAVGDLISRFIDEDGAVANASLDGRTMGADLDSLRDRRHSIGVAAGTHKAAITRAAVAAGLVSTLVLDDSLATELLTR